MADERPDLSTLWDYQDPAASAVRFQEVEAGLGPDAPLEYRLQLLTQLARTYSLRRLFDDAHAALDAIEDQVGDAPIAEVRWHLERGRAFRSAGDRDRARARFLHAISLAEPLVANDVVEAEAHLLDAMHMMGIASDTEEALEWNLRALAAARAASNPKAAKWQGSLLNNIGWTCFEADRIDEAHTYLTDALTWFREHGKARQIRIARYSVARVWRALGRHDEALAEQRAVHDEVVAADDGPDPYVVEEIGWNLVALGKDDAAHPFLTQALDALEADGWTPDNEPERLARLRDALDRE